MLAGNVKFQKYCYARVGTKNVPTLRLYKEKLMGVLSMRAEEMQFSCLL